MWWVSALCWGHAAKIELVRGRPREALVHCAAMREHAARIGDGGDVPLGAALEAVARVQLGEPCDVESRLVALRAADAPMHLAFAVLAAGEYELEHGDLATARRYADEAIVAATRTQRESAIVFSHALAARVALAEGREIMTHAAAVAAFDPALLSARAKLAHAELVRATLTA
jgi:hypothetical protein